MPTTFTHDLFGRDVYRKLSPSLQDMIREYGALYRIGQHGPDILFYYRVVKNRVTQLGSRMHKEPAKPFFERGLERARKEKDKALLVYLLGFACHFMLDSTCHPYIGILTDSRLVTHGHVEKELDRLLMQQEGLNPYHYYPSRCIKPSIPAARVIHKAIPEVSYPTVYATLRWMKFSTNLMVYDDRGRKQRILLPLLDLCGLGESIGDNFMRRDADRSCRPYLEELQKLYRKAVEDTVSMLEEFYQIYLHGGEVPERFNRDYN